MKNRSFRLWDIVLFNSSGDAGEFLGYDVYNQNLGVVRVFGETYPTLISVKLNEIYRVGLKTCY